MQKFDDLSDSFVTECPVRVLRRYKFRKFA